MSENPPLSPLNMGAPWDAISQPPGEDAAAYGQEIGSALARREPIDGLAALEAHIATWNKSQEIPNGITKTSITKTPDGVEKVDLSMDRATYEASLRDLQNYRQLLGGYAQQMGGIEQQLRMQEQAIRNQPPWLQLATALSANLAQAKNMPGWVQGLGATAAQLNPRPEEIQAKRMAVLGSEAQLAEKGAGLDIAMLRTMMEGGQKRETEQDRRVKTFMQDVRLSSKPGEPMPRETFEAKADLAEIPMELRNALYEGSVAYAKSIVGQEQRKVEQKKDLLTTASQLALKNGETLETLKAGNKLSYVRQAFALTHGQAALDFEKAKKEVDMAVAIKLAQAKSTGVISASDSQKLQGGLSTNTYLASIGDMLSQPEWGQVAEPLFVVDRGKNGSVEGVRINPEATLPKAWQSLSRAEADNMLKHEIPRLLALLFKQGVGAQMFRSKEGAKILMDLGISNSMRLDQMQSILNTIRETNNLSNFQPVAVTKHGVDWSNPDNAAMLALDDPLNAEFWAGRGRFGGPIPVTKPGGSKTTAPLSKAGFDAWLKQQEQSK